MPGGFRPGRRFWVIFILVFLAGCVFQDWLMWLLLSHTTLHTVIVHP